MSYRCKNLVTGLQLRAARTLAGMTQKDLAAALGINERAVRFWERKKHSKPVGGPNDVRIEQALLERGVILFIDPTPGARLAEAVVSRTHCAGARPFSGNYFTNTHARA